MHTKILSEFESMDDVNEIVNLFDTYEVYYKKSSMWTSYDTT